jgi:hypothetical protein
MNFQDLRKLGLYLYNNINYQKFLELMEIDDDSYALEKWNKFNENYLLFLIQYENFANNVLKEIEVKNEN